MPDFTSSFINNEPGSEKELENSINAIKVFGEAGITLVRQRFEGDTFPHLTTKYRSIQRGGMIARGESLGFTKETFPHPSVEEHEALWQRFCDA
ncbi:hypothetical protein [Neobacillus cucumis]|uniref:hypothetical protein n=1 Tax=Neobacillus cucumis TaxID=1740721 RepID=UPI0028530AC0|nr:hypothetical protein [Neobacillus cucumis]MDR4945585.1 hypothetical protein [Neobacillus cucumis]